MNLKLFRAIFIGLATQHFALSQITITTNSTSGVAVNTSSTPYTITGSGNIQASQLVGYLNSGNSVMVTSTGDLSVLTNITKTSGGGATLTLRAGDDLFIDSYNLTSSAGALNVVLWSGWTTNGARGIVSLQNSSIATNGGHLWVGGAAQNDANNGTTTWNGLTVGTNHATAFGTGSNKVGLLAYNNTITTGGGDAWFAGRASYGGSSLVAYEDQGIRWDQTSINSGGGALNFYGLIGNNSSLSTSAALFFKNATITGTGTGDLTFNGQSSGSSDNTDNDLFLDQGGLTVSWGSGDVLLQASRVSRSSTSNYLTLSSAGSFSFEPSSNSTSWDAAWAGNDFGIDGTVSALMFTGSNDAQFLKINNISTSGLVFGTATCGNGVQVYGGLSSVGSLTLKSGNYTTINAATSVSSSNGVTIVGGDVYVLGPVSAGGPISITGGELAISANLVSSLSGAEILMKGTGGIVLAESKTVQTNGGDITFWSNTDDNGGVINIKDNSVLDSRTAADRTATNTSTATGGGAITLGGGSVGTTKPVGAALYTSGSGILGAIQLGTYTTNTAHNANITIYSGGGDISLSGASALVNPTGDAAGILSFEGVQANAGVAGNISITGACSASANINDGINFGAWSGNASSPAASTWRTHNGDITISGTAINGTHNRGTLLYANSTLTPLTFAITGSGNLSLTGNGTLYDILITAVNLLAANGNITLTGTGSGSLFTDSRGVNTLGRLSTSPVTTSTSNIVVNDNTFGLTSAKGLQFNTAGSVTVQPYGTSFGAAFTTTDMAFSTDITGLTIGKLGNTSNVSLSSNISTAGPITIVGSDISLRDLTVSSGSGNISVLAAGSITDAQPGTGGQLGLHITTSGGDILLAANTDNTGGGNIYIDGYTNLSSTARPTFVSNGGAITLGGGDATASGFAKGTSSSVKGIYLEGPEFNSSGGAIVLRGEGYQSDMGINFAGNNDAVINSGTGSIYLHGKQGSTLGSNSNQFALNFQAPNYTEITSACVTSTAITLIGEGLKHRGIDVANALRIVSTGSATGGNGGITITGQRGSTQVNAISLQGGGYILSNSGPIVITAKHDPNSTANLGYFVVRGATLDIGSKAGSAVTSSTADVTITSDAFDAMTANIKSSINTNGTLTIQPYQTSFGSVNYYAGTTLNYMPSSFFNLNGNSQAISGLNFGKSGNTRQLEVSDAVTVSGPIVLHGGAIDINADLTATSSSVTINASGTVSQTSGSGITATSLALQNTGTFNLTEPTNDLDILAAGSPSSVSGAISFMDSDGFEVGTVGGQNGITSSGLVSLKSLNGNVTVSQDIATTSTSTNAVVVMADYDAAAGAAGNGNILISGTPSLTTGANGIVKLYSGSESLSTGLNGLVGGASNTRYLVDQNTSTFSPALSANQTYALYRTFGPNNPGFALDFDGVDDHVVTPQFVEQSVEMWVKLGTAGQMMIYSGANSNTTGLDYSICTYEPNGIGGNSTFDNNTYGVVFSFWGHDIVVPFNDIVNGWHHIACVWDGATSASVYIDGVLHPAYYWNLSSFSGPLSQPITMATTPTPSNNASWIGRGRSRFWGNGSFYFDGQIDEVRIWSDARTTEEVRENMCRSLADPVNEAGLLAYYKFNEGSGTSAMDSKGSNTGALTNMVGAAWTASTAFNTWTPNSANWNDAGNWSRAVVPTLSDNVGIYSGASYSPIVNTSATVSSLTIGATASASVAAQSSLTVGKNFINAGALTLNASASGYSQLKVSGEIIGAGTVMQNQYMSGSGHHGVSSPMTNGFTTVTNGDATKLYGFDAASGQWAATGAGTTVAGAGFFGPLEASGFLTSNGTFDATGTPNTAHTHNLGYASLVAAGGSGSGWNLIGNPYTCGLNWASVGITKTNVNDAIYIWDPATETYKYYVDGTSAPSGWSGTYAGSQLASAVVAPMQAFWVQATSNGASVSSSMATDGSVASSPTYYKSNPDNLVLSIHHAIDTSKGDVMWLKNVSGTGLGFEGSHDAWKMMNAGGQPNLYSCDLDQKLAINAIDFKTIRSVPVGLEEAIDGTPFVMHLDQVVNDQWYQVYLEDKYLNQITNITAMDYSFTSMPAVQAGPRFVLHFDLTALHTDEEGSSKALVYQSGDRIIITGTDASEYRIVSIDGRLIAQGTLHESSSSIAAPPKAGVYLVQLFGAKTQSERLIIQ